MFGSLCARGNVYGADYFESKEEKGGRQGWDEKETIGKDTADKRHAVHMQPLWHKGALWNGRQVSINTQKVLVANTAG
jgi:hypothetical protein